MGQKNNVLLDYLNDPRRFADLFNGYFCNGEMMVNPEFLDEADSKLDGPLGTEPETGDKSSEIEKIRDVRKKYKNGEILQILCLEDQEYIDYSAAIRTLAMDALEYNHQLREIKKTHRENRDYTSSDEYLSGMLKGDSLKPVITLWWYHGSRPYDGPRSLKDSFNRNGPIPEEMLPDYRLNILLNDDIGFAGKFHTEFKKLYKTLAVKNDKIALKKLFREDSDFTDIDEETLRAISVVIDRPRIWEDREKSKIRKGEYNMCLAFDQIEEDARMEGYNNAKIEFQEAMEQKDREIAFLKSLLEDKNKQSEAN